MDKTNKLKQEIEEYLTRDYCCEFKEECKDGIRIRCSEYEAKLYLILRFAEPREKRIAELEAQTEKMKSIGRTSYIKGIRTMTNALKDYDRTDGAWTDYFEHTVDKVFKKITRGDKRKMTGIKHFASVGDMLENKFSQLGYKDDNGNEIEIKEND